MMRRLWLCMVVGVVSALAAAGAQAQRPPAPNPVLQNQNQDQPVQIEAAMLEVRDKNKIATFSGNVQVVQGDTTLKCKVLVVFYGQEFGVTSGAGAAPSKPTTTLPQDAQSIRRIEARGDVTVTSKDQNASGDLGVYDLKTKTITLTGNVVVTQGQNVIHGDRVIVDTVTGNARVESAANAAGATSTTPSRVRALILPHSNQNGAGSGHLLQLGPSRTN
jgi:lipopolysaccharide export system protein LptA